MVLKSGINGINGIKPLSTSLVVLWLRIHLPMQGTRLQFLAGELRFPQAERQLSPGYNY